MELTWRPKSPTEDQCLEITNMKKKAMKGPSIIPKSGAIDAVPIACATGIGKPIQLRVKCAFIITK